MEYRFCPRCAAALALQPLLNRRRQQVPERLVSLVQDHDLPRLRVKGGRHAVGRFRQIA